MDHLEIFEPFDRLVKLCIGSDEYEVPENNSILRCMQYIDMEAVSEAELCWNGECLNCKVWLDGEGREKVVIACRTNVEDGMHILKMSDEINVFER